MREPGDPGDNPFGGDNLPGARGCLVLLVFPLLLVAALVRWLYG